MGAKMTPVDAMILDWMLCLPNDLSDLSVMSLGLLGMLVVVGVMVALSLVSPPSPSDERGNDRE